MVATPEKSPADPLLRSLLSVKSPSELFQIASRHALIVSIRPRMKTLIFSTCLRFSDALNLFAKDGVLQLLGWQETGVIGGNLIATTVLVGLILILTMMSVLTVVVPLVFRPISGDPEFPAGRVVWSGAIYFSLIGAGFMLLEIAMMQRLSVFLGHPVYGLGVVLCVIILSTGVGSFLSERLPLTRAPWVYGFPVLLSVMIIGVRFVLAAFMTNLVAAPMAVENRLFRRGDFSGRHSAGILLSDGHAFGSPHRSGGDSLVLGLERDFRSPFFRSGCFHFDLCRHQHELLPGGRVLFACHALHYLDFESPTRSKKRDPGAQDSASFAANLNLSSAAAPPFAFYSPDHLLPCSPDLIPATSRLCW